MSNVFKKVCAIHDLSCYGRCALTVIIPTMSRLGCQVVPIPTALLSTHTGGFSDMHFTDLTDQMKEICDHLKSINIKFDALFTGFLGSARQIETVEYIINSFADKNTLFLLDPVMGDDGILYSTYTDKMVDGIRQLSLKADILTPNLTEACLLAEEKYPDLSNISVNEAESISLKIMKKLSEKYQKADIVITGVICKNKIFSVCKEKQNEPVILENELQPISFPGTGDLFASLLISYIMKGDSFMESTKKAADMTTEAVKLSQSTDEDVRNGILLEKFLCETNFN